MYLIDTIKHNVEKKFKTFFLRDCLGEVSHKRTNKPIFVFFLCYIFERQQNFLHYKRENKLFNLLFHK